MLLLLLTRVDFIERSTIIIATCIFVIIFIFFAIKVIFVFFLIFLDSSFCSFYKRYLLAIKIQ